MSSLLIQILFQADRGPPLPIGPGRKIIFDKTQPDISLVTGTLRERIEEYLHLTNEPATATEIAQGINSNPSRVISNLQVLQRSGKVVAIKIDGCITEYLLAK